VKVVVFSHVIVRPSSLGGDPATALVGSMLGSAPRRGCSAGGGIAVDRQSSTTSTSGANTSVTIKQGAVSTCPHVDLASLIWPYSGTPPQRAPEVRGQRVLKAEGLLPDVKTTAISQRLSLQKAFPRPPGAYKFILCCESQRCILHDPPQRK